MEKSIQPLVVTPFPKSTESLIGFLLRTSELNGYESPNVVLRHAGLTENEIRSVRPPLVKLAQLYARDLGDFEQAGYSDQPTNRYSKHWLVQNQPLPGMYVNVKKVGICPECIKEYGFIDGFFDLKYALACPSHGRMVISVCPACGKPLRRNRPGMLTCSCGQDLAGFRGDQVDDASVLDILELIRLKLHGDLENNTRLNRSGFPIHELRAVSLATLFGIISRLEPGKKRKTRFDIPAGITIEMHALTLASGLLSRWPYGLYDHLENQYRLNAPPAGSTLHRQFHLFNCAFFKSGLPTEEVAFLQRAFMQFGHDQWKKGFIDPRLPTDAPRNIVGMKGLADHLGIMVPTAEQYVKKGIITGEPVDTASSTRLIFDLSLIPFKKAEGKRHRQRSAAKLLGLPVKLLSMLRKSGVYKVTRLAWGLDGYSELDLIDFKNRLTSNAPALEDFDSVESISLREISRKKNGLDGAARIISAILEGRIFPLGRSGNHIGDILLDRDTTIKIATHIDTVC